MSEQEPAQSGDHIGDVLGAPSRPFLTFPTPEEVGDIHMTVAALEYVEDQCGTSPADAAGWETFSTQHPIRAMRIAIEAVINQHELETDQPLRWPVGAVKRLSVSAMGEYITAIMGAMRRDQGVGVEAAAEDERPTVKRVSGRARTPRQKKPTPDAESASTGPS